MDQRCGGTRFRQEHGDGDRLPALEFRAEQFQGARSIQHVVAGAEHPRHAAPSQEVFQRVEEQRGSEQEPCEVVLLGTGRADLLARHRGLAIQDRGIRTGCQLLPALRTAKGPGARCREIAAPAVSGVLSHFRPRELGCDRTPWRTGTLARPCGSGRAGVPVPQGARAVRASHGPRSYWPLFASPAAAGAVPASCPASDSVPDPDSFSIPSGGIWPSGGISPSGGSSSIFSLKSLGNSSSS